MTQSETVELVHAPSRIIAGRSGRYSMETRNQIPGLWQQFFTEPPEIENVIEGAFYGVSYGMTSGGEFDYAVGLEVPSTGEALPEGCCHVTLSEGDYLVLRTFGPVAELPQQFDRVFSELIPANSLVPREGAVFERYPHDERNTLEAMAYEIWAPVKATA
ncbi:GyrI-like domain-containing protein [Aliiroseovarius sp. F20344]|uniref:GyrI-like domain-containing protein n=1 Tax=Aliiroseovarius sp. F20344 TaxID=2926414 RepID=UPI001FF22728|nr:GyrI-like domain-containing protein [Aliiroseovarius sp. F20344]MCK0140910.1 GyrI-like domain-containing protein [Aliiroseovarius sp. F20344]